MSEKRFDKIDATLEKLDSRLDNVDVTLAKQHVSLEEHMRRSDLLEEKMKPVEAHVAMVNGVFKFLGIASLIVGLIAGIKSLF